VVAVPSAGAQSKLEQPFMELISYILIKDRYNFEQ
jgi:hypothetical protein